MAQDITFKIVADTGQVDKNLDNLNKNLEKSQDNIKGLNKGIKATGDAAGKSKKGLGLMAKGFKGIGTALKAAGIGIIIALFVALFEALKKNQKIMDAINVVMETVSIVFNKIATAVGNAIAKFKDSGESIGSLKDIFLNIIKLAFLPFRIALLGIKEAIIGVQIVIAKLKRDKDKVAELTAEAKKLKDEFIDSTKAAAVGLINTAKAIVTISKSVINEIRDINIKASIEQSKALVLARKNLEGLNIELEKQKLIFQKNAELQRQIRDDETKSFDERIQANKDLGIILDKQSVAERKLINEKITLAKLELATNKDSQVLIDNLAREKVGLLELDERLTGQRSEQIVNQVSLEKEANQEIIDDKKEAAETLKGIYRRTNEQKLEDERDAQILSVESALLSEQEKVDALLEIEKNYQIDLQLLKDGQIEATSSSNQDEIDARKELNKKIFNDSVEIANILFDYKQTLLNNELTNLDQQLKDGLISQEDFDDKVGEIKTQQAKADKKQALFNIAIGTAVAIVESMPNPILIALSAAIGIAQAAVVASQKIPEFAQGGVLHGPSHADGGILTPFGQLEGGEGVINNTSMSNPSLRNLASVANVAGGGVNFGTGDGSIKLAPDSIAQIVNGINNKKVFVTETDITDAQNRVSVIEEDAIL